MHVFAGLFLLSVVVIILPSFVYMLIIVWDMMPSVYAEKDNEDLECACSLRGLSSADNSDEYVARLRPDLLSLDIVTAQEADPGETKVVPHSACDSDLQVGESRSSVRISGP
jgi:hypothetical protein